MDFTTGHIYFTAVASELYESYVGILHPQKSVHKKLITQLGTPRAIAVHPSAGYVKFVFWECWFGDSSPPHPFYKWLTTPFTVFFFLSFLNNNVAKNLIFSNLYLQRQNNYLFFFYFWITLAADCPLTRHTLIIMTTFRFDFAVTCSGLTITKTVPILGGHSWMVHLKEFYFQKMWYGQTALL